MLAFFFRESRQQQRRIRLRSLFKNDSSDEAMAKIFAVRFAGAIAAASRVVFSANDVEFAIHDMVIMN